MPQFRQCCINLQLASPMQSERRLQVFSLPFTLHNWRCNISENFLFVRLWREFIVYLWVNWNLGYLKNCFQSPGSSTRLHSLCALFQCVLRCPDLCYDFERPKMMKFWEGCVHTSIWSILTICVCFLNCCFGILMSRSFSFKRSIWQVNPGSQCLKTACPKEASGNTLHHHTWVQVALEPSLVPMCISCNSEKLPVDMPNLLQNFSFSVCATNNPNYTYLNDIDIKFEYLVV